MRKSIVILQFSSRDKGNCSGIVSFLNEYYSKTDVCNFVVDANNMPACSNCNYECLKNEEVCPNITEGQKGMFDAICGAETVFFIVPNYCGFPCANYFAFNERSVGYFNKDRSLMGKYMSVQKRFIIVSNTQGQNFEAAMMQQVNSEPDILYMKTGKYRKKSIDGDMLDSEEAKADLRGFLES